MPFLRIQTNLPVRKEQEEKLLSAASHLVSSHLDKDQKFFMGQVQGQLGMSFAGSTGPLAFLELDALGLSTGKARDLSRDLCRLVADELSIRQDRIYLKFQNVERGMWGWNGGVF